ncbi:PTS sugar transporter subunit IIA [Oceanotoga teriensis]|jgi:PTS system ascorbate-specific IIA component|uniref:PTS sugar transporter subunit IIA n=1 Tax=Oceanotoga teriensis TaxID=515440 RepID=UPI002713EC7F|nr:PTS sugar transporter subunit IIA [Oceanotoga teriensis]MDO7976450.1 PTS sugar transporter subunit IIA [Oceanotoga teriensis]
MLKQKFELKKDYINFAESVKNWEEAIKLAAQPLLNNNFVTNDYINAMIATVKEFGPYICIAPGLAMPHARPEKGALSMGFSILKLNKSVEFAKDSMYHSKILIALSCVNSDDHIKMMQKIAEVLSQEDKIKKIFNAKTKEEIIEVFGKIVI